jgi:hypothetical protein
MFSYPQNEGYLPRTKTAVYYNGLHVSTVSTKINIIWDVRVLSSNLKIEEECTSETSVMIYLTTRRRISSNLKMRASELTETSVTIYQIYGVIFFTMNVKATDPSETSAMICQASKRQISCTLKLGETRSSETSVTSYTPDSRNPDTYLHVFSSDKHNLDAYIPNYTAAYIRKP